MDGTLGSQEHRKAVAEKKITELLVGKRVEIVDLPQSGGKFFSKAFVDNTHFEAQYFGKDQLSARIGAVKSLLPQLRAWCMVNDLPMPSYAYHLTAW